MQADVGYLHNRLAKIDGFGETGEYLLGIIQTRIPDAPAPTTPEPEKTEAKGSDDGKTDDKINGSDSEKKEEAAGNDK
jgi:vacuolar protein sorting-associated protein 54